MNFGNEGFGDVVLSGPVIGGVWLVYGIDDDLQGLKFVFGCRYWSVLGRYRICSFQIYDNPFELGLQIFLSRLSLIGNVPKAIVRDDSRHIH